MHVCDQRHRKFKNMTITVMGPYCKLIPIKNGLYILVEVSFYILAEKILTIAV